MTKDYLAVELIKISRSCEVDHKKVSVAEISQRADTQSDSQLGGHLGRLDELHYTALYWTVLDYVGLCWTVLDCVGL